ncbi:Quino protein amine dehydrogenase [Suillus variegatus]|nr:Quino protein amine dehydrogenase [Suillus variegatus]
MCWSPDGGQVLGISARSSRTPEGSQTFRVWDVKSGETIVGPIKAGGFLRTLCYSPDGKVIATTGDDGLKIWDANTGKLLKTLQCPSHFWCLAWTSNGKTLTTWGRQPVPLGKVQMMKFDTATWAVLDVPEDLVDSSINSVLPSPDGRFFATISVLNRTARLQNIETNQPIGTPLHHEHWVSSGTFSADVDATPRPAPKMKSAPRIPQGFFDDALREANLRIRLSQSHGPHDHPTPVPRQRTFSRFPSFWRRSKSHGEIEHHTRPLSHSLNWTRNLVSGMLRRRDGSDIELREVEVPYTAGKPRNYHARKKPTSTSSQAPKIHTMQKPNASSSQLPATASTLSGVAGTVEASGTPSRPHITGTGWRVRFVGWICCMPIQNTDGHH